MRPSFFFPTVVSLLSLTGMAQAEDGPRHTASLSPTQPAADPASPPAPPPQPGSDPVGASVASVADTIDDLTGRGRPTGWHEDHPVAVGTRTAGWVGAYSAPGLGGQIKIRPVEWAGVSLFSDNFIRPQDDAIRRDHVIGFSLFAPAVLGNEKHYIAPALGACVDFRYVHPLEDDAPSVADVLFGAHLGAMAEVWMYKGLSLEMNAAVYEYVGHDTGLSGWSATVSRDLTFSTVGQLTASANYYF